MGYSNSQGAALEPPAELSAEQGYGLDRRLTSACVFPRR
jgi:hypothetical protein